MIELIKSRHLRAKIACLALFYYIIFHSSGLIWLIAQYSDDESTIQWSDPTFWAILSSIVFQSLATAIWLYLIFIIIFLHRKYFTDIKWQDGIKKLVLYSSISYSIGIFLLLVEALRLQAYFFEIYLVLMNKSFILMLIYNIYYDLNLKKQRKERLLLYGEILEFYSLCHGIFTTIIFFYYIGLASRLAWFIFVPMCCFWCLFCVSFQYSFVGQKACCKRWCNMDRISDGDSNASYSAGTKPFCPYGPKTIADHLLFSGTILLLYANVIFNYNDCISYNNAFENIFGIRGYAFLNFYYCILMAVEFNFGGLPNNKQAQLEENKAGKDADKQSGDNVISTDELL